MAVTDVLEQGKIKCDVNSSSAFNAASPNTVHLNGFPFNSYNPDNPFKTGFGGANNDMLSKSLDTFRRYQEVQFDVKHGRYDPIDHNNIPDPSKNKVLYDGFKAEALNKLQNDPTALSGIPPHLKNDKILQMAHLIDGMVNSRLKQDETYDDDKHWSGDYMFHPYATLAAGTGDCDDYATLKRQMLRDMGVPDNRVFVMTGKDGSTGGGHATCVVIGDDGKSYVIDNGPGGKAALTPLDDYIKKYDFQPLAIETDNSVYVLPQEDYVKGRQSIEQHVNPEQKPAVAAPASTQ